MVSIIVLSIGSPLSTINYIDAKSDTGEEASGGKGDNGNGHNKDDDGDDGDDGDNGDDGDRKSGDQKGKTSDDTNLVGKLSTVIMNNTNSTTVVLNNTSSTQVDINNNLDSVSLTSNLCLANDFTNTTDDFTNTNNFSSAINITPQDSFDEKAFYILIKTENNRTSFVPDKVTLTAGDKIVWLNQDNTGHRITVGSDTKTGYQLVNMPILPNGKIDHQFQSSGTSFSVLDNLVSKGDITILEKGNEDHAVSIPLGD